ncbi:unnamed protein product [Blepharisma stoltei]|uniref:Calponin-homology (CH) domain-containing protein n=1 Tax=Blepharisma stoltei TaxID=1481888 RepID=A0AAU9JJR8_9CILI|nr:unnamed protein product [Blepharisma stoltei]
MSNKTTQYFNQENVILIDWVNSLSIPSCLLVSNSNDLKGGCALCDIAAQILNKIPFQNIYRDQALPEHKAIHNLRVLIKEIKGILPESLRNLTAELLYQDDSKIFALLKWFVRVLDMPFYDKLRSIFRRIQTEGRESEMTDRPRISESNERITTPSLSTVKPTLGVNKQLMSTYEDLKMKNLNQVLNSTDDRPNQVSKRLFEPLAYKGTNLVSLLKDLHVIDANSSDGDFMNLCTNGVLFGDLVNVLEGREEKVKGINRKTRTPTDKAANISKALKYLRGMSKMDSTYLWSEKEILAGNIEVILGLIYQILTFYRRIPRNEQQLLVPRTPREPKHDFEPILTRNSDVLSSSKSVKKLNREYPSLLVTPTYENIHTAPIMITQEIIDRTIDWLVSLELGHLISTQSREFTTDNLRNGVLFCELASIITKIPNLVKYKTPRTLAEAKENIEIAFNTLREVAREVPVSFFYQAENVIKGDINAIWGLLCHLMLSYPNLLPISPNIAELPYFPLQIQELEASLLDWIMSLGVVDRNNAPSTFQELIPDLISGVLLCDLVSRILEKPITGIFRSPKTEQLALSNIKRALAPLRIERRMSLKYVFSEAEILKGNLGVILGLLEDLRRFSDGLPPRKRGTNYHSNGPYLGSALSRSTSAQKLNQSKLLTNVEDSPMVSPIYSPRFYLSKETAGSQSRRLLSTERSALSIFKSLNSSSEEAKYQCPEGFSWLEHLNIKLPENLNLEADNIQEFRTGLFLCEIISKLERNPIEGMHYKVSSQAACRHNIAKAFQILRTKPSFPSELYFCEDFVYCGDAKTIRKVLRAIYKVYRRTISNFISFSRRKNSKLAVE